MAKTDYKSIDEYHAACPPEQVARMQQIREIIHRVVPEVEETISYQIPCFKYQGYLLYYCTFPGHLSLSYPFSPALLQAFAGELSSYKMSKSVIQFPHNRVLPLALIEGIVAFRKQENEANPKKKK